MKLNRKTYTVRLDEQTKNKINKDISRIMFEKGISYNVSDYINDLVMEKSNIFLENNLKVEESSFDVLLQKTLDAFNKNKKALLILKKKEEIDKMIFDYIYKYTDGKKEIISNIIIELIKNLKEINNKNFYELQKDLEKYYLLLNEDKISQLKILCDYNNREIRRIKHIYIKYDAEDLFEKLLLRIKRYKEFRSEKL